MSLLLSTIDSKTSATMRLHGEIGSELSATLFIEELNALVNAGYTNLTIRIHSVGGDVVAGYGIFSELLKSKATITTINEGLAASTAGWLLLAGTSVKMADYALFMLHNPSTADASPKAQEVVALMRDSIITIISQRTGQTVEAVSEMMHAETWLNAEKCYQLGFITEEPIKTQKLVALNPEYQNVRTMYQVVNSALGIEATAENPEAVVIPAVENAAEVLETPEAVAATEEVETPEAIEARLAVEAEAERVAAEAEAAAVAPVVPAGPTAEELQALVTANAELTARLAEIEPVLNAYKAKEAEAKETKAKLLVTNAIASGRIQASAENHWVTLAKDNYPLAESTLASLSVETRSTVSALNKVATIGSAASATKTFRQLEKENPTALAKLKVENFVAFNELYFNQYGKNYSV